MATALNKLQGAEVRPVPSSKGMSFGIVVSEWNPEITLALIKGAKKMLLEQGADEENIHVKYVPGSFELPLAAQFFMQHTDVEAVIAIGCIIRGETKHFDFIAEAVAKGILEVSLAFSKPVVFGVLTTDTIEQALARAGGKLGNKGSEAAEVAIKMVEMKKKFMR